MAANEQIEQLRSRLAAVQASIVTEVADRKIAKQELAWGSTGDWFTHTAGQQRTVGHRTVRQAPVLVRERTATHAGLAAGVVSPEQAAVIVDAVDALPLDEHLRAKAEGILLEEAGRLDATALAVVGKKIAAVVDPDGEERRQQQKLDREERAAHHRRFLSITDDGAGGAWLKGRGTAEDAAILKAALLPLTKPAPAVDSAVDPENPEEQADGQVETDPRDHGARLWDALVATCQHALATDLPPQCHGARPRLAVTTDLDSLRVSGLRTSGSTGPASARPTPPAPCWPATGAPAAPPRTAPTSHPPPSGGWPATPTSSPSPSAPAAKCWTSAAPTAS